MMTEEERLEHIKNDLPRKLAEARQTLSFLRHSCEEVKELDLEHLYDRREIQTVDALKNFFTRLFGWLMKDIFVVIEILEGEEPKGFAETVFYRTQNLLYFMQQLELIDDWKLFEEDIQEVIRIIKGERIEMDSVKLIEDVMKYTEDLAKALDKSEDFVKRKYFDGLLPKPEKKK